MLIVTNITNMPKVLEAEDDQLCRQKMTTLKSETQHGEKWAKCETGKNGEKGGKGEKGKMGKMGKIGKNEKNGENGENGWNRELVACVT